MVTKMVTSADVREFQFLYTNRFGIDLSSNDARTKLELVVRQMELVYQPITKSQLQSINENENTNEQSKQQPTINC